MYSLLSVRILYLSNHYRLLIIFTSEPASEPDATLNLGGDEVTLLEDKGKQDGEDNDDGMVAGRVLASVKLAKTVCK